ncbi:MAG: CRTAC1 family protein [Bryobacterales bacterium]|nr:CRTAC1 family protein [Bryobacterales bacterium]
MAFPPSAILLSSAAFLAAVCLLQPPSAGRAASRRPRFMDVAPNSRFPYISNNDFRKRKYFPQPMCGGVAILDYDKDGWMDIFLTNGATLPELRRPDSSFYNCLLRNKHDGTFEDVTKVAGLAGENLEFSFGAAAGDYDNDGYPDLFVAGNGRNTLYHNNGDGTFRDVTAQSGLAKPPDTLSVHAAWFDYDNDGLLDLAVANYTLWTPQTDRRCRRGEEEMYCSPKTYPSVPQRLYHNLGGGRFSDVTESSGFGKIPGKGMGICAADFNKDGWMDVVLANDTERNFLFLNRRNGAFEEAGLRYGAAYNENGAAVSAMGCDAKDFDNDGWPDLYYNDLMGQIWGIFANHQGRRFDYVSPRTKILQLSAPYSGWSTGFFDYDNDGWKDIYSANGDVDNLTPQSPQHDTLFENQAGKEFLDVSPEMGRDFLRKGYQRGSAFADLNNDGFPDIVVTSLQQRPRILINSADNGNHWLLIELAGGDGNRDASGAWLKLVTPSGRALYNHVTASIGFLSSSDPRVHFGLGSEKSASSLEIHWPSGEVRTLKNVPADQILRIVEHR